MPLPLCTEIRLVYGTDMIKLCAIAVTPAFVYCNYFWPN